jgi:hypothetical protein
LFRGHNIKEFSSILAGIGWGLFIDELGKFITSDNNYFYQPAAPIIYLLFVILAFTILFVQRKLTNISNSKTDNQTKIFQVIEDLEEIARKDFDSGEKKESIKVLKQVIATEQDIDQKTFAQNLLRIVEGQKITGNKDKSFSFSYVIVQRIRTAFSKFIKSRKFMLALLVFLSLRVLLIAINLYFVLNPVTQVVGVNASNPVILWILKSIVQPSQNNVGLVVTLLSSQVIINFMIIISLSLSLFRNRYLIRPVKVLIIISIVFVDVLLFYVNQMSTFATSIIDLLLFLLINELQKSEVVTDS